MGAGCPRRGSPFPDSASPPTPTPEPGVEGQAPLWAPPGLSGSEAVMGECLWAPPRSLRQTLLLCHLTNPNSDSIAVSHHLKNVRNKFRHGTVYHKFNDQMTDC